MNKTKEIKKKRIEANIFPKSRQAYEPYNDFIWNRYSHQNNSSQALMLDVFGFLDYSKFKKEIINKLFGFSDDQNWKIIFDKPLDENLLNEKTQSQIDIILMSNKHNVVMECKFTEEDGGSCSQTEKLHRSGLIQCNGNYEQQINPNNKLQSKCALTAKGIKYWYYIEKIYYYSSSEEYQECPFKNAQFQWMRNLCIAYALEEKTNRKTSFCICYYDSKKLSLKRKMDRGYLDVINLKVKENRKVSKITYNQIIQTGLDFTNNDLEKEDWKALKEWVENKLEKIN